MLTEVSIEEACALTCLGDVSFGLIVQTKSSEIIFENLKVRNNTCYYYHQEHGQLEDWSNNMNAIDVVNLVLNLDPKRAPRGWKKFIKIYHIEEI